jgi:hypothetical protein
MAQLGSLLYLTVLIADVSQFIAVADGAILTIAVVA